MTNLNKALPNYLSINEKNKNPKYKNLSNKDFDKKIDDAFKILKKCDLCERKCQVDRADGKLGWCKVGNEIRISSYFDHLGEEPFLIPSFTIFFISCNFSCQFCQNWTLSQNYEEGVIISVEKLASVIDEHSYCKNVNFVGGEPTPYLPFILKTLKLVKSPIPVVWNSNFYMTEKSMDLLSGIVDVYLSDFKYGNDLCAERLSKVKDYFKVVSRNHLYAFNDSELVIRHLVLPNHFECCTKKIFDFIKKHFEDKVIVNIMDQYKPEWKACKYDDINKKLSLEEFEKAAKYAETLGLNFIT